MTNISKIMLGALCMAGVTFYSCNDDDEPNNVEPSLYTRLGGTTMVEDPNNPSVMIEKGRLSYRSVVDTTITLIVADIVANEPGNFSAHFAPLVGEVSSGNATNVAVLSKNLTDFFSANTGGGETNTYTGLDMVSAHDPAINDRMGIKVNNAAYDKFVGYVVEAAALNGVTNQEIIADVGAVLESLRAPIVQDPN